MPFTCGIFVCLGETRTSGLRPLLRHTSRGARGAPTSWEGEVPLRRAIALLLIAAIAAGAAFLVSRTVPAAVPRKASALEQYFYARETWFEPGFRLKGSERQRTLQDAVRGMQAVVERFPDNDAVVTRALAEYDTGLCYRTLGETDRAREAFLRVRDYKRFTSAATHPSGRDALEALLEAARERLRDLDGRP